MKLKSVLVAGALACAVTGASATNYTIDLGTPSAEGVYSKGFNSVVKTSGSFEDTFTFTPVTQGWSQGSLITVSNNSHDVIQFLGATLNGNSFTFGSIGTGTYGFTLADYFTGPLILKVWGIASPSLPAGSKISASYGGTVTVSAVPEPETYAMMLAGLGLFGFVARRKASKKEEEAESQLATA